MKRLGYVTFGALALLAAASRSDAVVFNFSGLSNTGSGDVLNASVEFLVAGTTLTVIVTNTDDNAAFNGADVLNAVYFNIAGDPTLSNGNAALTAGSSFELRDNGVPGSTNPPNHEWFWRAPNVAAGSQYSFGASGGIGFSSHETFDAVFHGGSASGGANDDYGIIPTLGQTAGNMTNVYANNSMTFTFDMSAPISEGDIYDVFVSYGSNGQTVLVPEPATLGALAVGALALLRRRRKS